MLMKGFVLCRIIHGLINALNALRSSPALVSHSSFCQSAPFAAADDGDKQSDKDEENCEFAVLLGPVSQFHVGRLLSCNVCLCLLSDVLVTIWLMATRTCQKCPTKYHDGEDAPLRANELR